MQLPNKAQKGQMFKSMYKSSIQASYFNSFKGNRFVEQSKIEFIKKGEEQIVDQNTFRIMKSFNVPDNSFVVNQKIGFFSCISSVLNELSSLKDFKFKVIDRSHKLKYFFNFQTDNATIESKGNYFQILIDSCKQKFVFYPIQQKKADHFVDDWVSLINKVIKSSDAKNHKLNYLSAKIPNFYQQYHLSRQQFQKSANTLDIILFKSPHSAASIQRLFTNSQYDHVGVILRNKKNELFIFESTSGEGVGLTPWKDLIRYQWYDSCDKIAWRRLNMQISEKDIDVTQAYVAKTLGQGFEISLDKLFVFSSKLQRSKQQQEKKTYFCSQLVARLYKQIGLLDQKKSSTSYYPVDFSQKITLQMSRDKAYLQPEKVISFSYVNKK